MFFCCLGPFIVWYTGEDEDGPVTLRESLQKPPYGQRCAPPVESDFASVLRRHKQSTKGKRRNTIREVMSVELLSCVKNIYRSSNW